MDTTWQVLVTILLEVKRWRVKVTVLINKCNVATTTTSNKHSPEGAAMNIFYSHITFEVKRSNVKVGISLHSSNYGQWIQCQKRHATRLFNLPLITLSLTKLQLNCLAWRILTPRRNKKQTILYITHSFVDLAEANLLQKTTHTYMQIKHMLI